MSISGTGFKNGVINLDDPQAVYYSAQSILGKIEFRLELPLSFSAINIVYHGSANVSWKEPQTEMYSGVKRYTNVEYKGYEEYFNCVQCVCGGNGTSVLPAGLHSIPFSYQIPNNAPSSYNSSIGKVSYKITAYLESPAMREELVKTFEVIAPLDLNKDPSGDFKRPIVMDFEEMYSCCCSSQPISVRIRVPVSGFCPGQTVPIDVSARNDSNTEITKILFQLVMRERYHSRAPVSEYIIPENVLATSKKGAIMGNTRREYQCELIVPEIFPPYLVGCSIIDVGYFLKVIIKLSGCNDDLQDECEIFLGLVPLEMTTAGGNYVHPLKHMLPQGRVPQIVDVSDNTNTVTHVQNLSNQLRSNEYLNLNPLPSYPQPSAPYPQAQTEPYAIGFKI